MATTSTNFVAALGTGSGIDIQALARGLVDAEKAPQEALIQTRIDKAESRIAGYNTVLYALDQLKSAVQALRDPSAFNTTAVASNAPTAVAVTSSGSGAVGQHEIEVSRLAQAQRVVSTRSFAATDTVSAVPYTIRLTLADAASTFTDITVSDASPAGLVQAINGANFGGITASVVDTGSGATPLRIVISGQQGQSNGFSITDVGGPALAGTGLETAVDPPSALNRVAVDAELTVDGLLVTRPSNRIGDLIQGATLDLLKTTSTEPLVADRVVTVNLTRDVAPVKDKIRQIVTTYNDLQAILDAALDKDSTVEKLGGSLVGDTTVKAVRDQVRRILMPTTGASSDPQAALTDLRQLGLFIDGDGRMKFASMNENGTSFATAFQVGSEATLDKALATRFDDVAELFSGVNGIGRDMADRLSGSGAHLDSSVRPSSPIRILSVQSRNANERIFEDKDRLKDLEDRMEGLLVRYLEQFSVMETLVGQSKSMRSGIENSFKAMSGSR